MKDTVKPGVLFDYARSARVGLPEAVFSEGKSESVLIELLEQFANGSQPILFTRLSQSIFDKAPKAARQRYDYDPVSRTAFAACFPERDCPGVAIVSAGTSDAPVAREAARTLKYLGIPASLFEDCGVAGLWRLTEHLPQISAHKAAIIVAGMEGALASVAGGLLGMPIFAVPTSVGYGVSSDGRVALASMLASCAPGIAVLNIDNGYGAACAAARVINSL